MLTSRRPRARATSWCRRGCSPGSFYALPQSPQLFKQLLHVRRLRALLPDRPLLPRRGPARRPPARVHAARHRDVLRRARGGARARWRACTREIWQRGAGRRGRAAAPAALLRTRRCCRYGSDKPDLRYGLEIADVTELVRGLGVRRLPRRRVEAGGVVRALAVPRRGRAGAQGHRRARRRSPRSGAARASRYLMLEPSPASCARRSPSSSAEPELDGAPRGDGRRGRATRSSWRGRHRGDRRRACSARCARTSPSSFDLIDRRRLEVPVVVDFPLFQQDEDERRLGGRAPPVHGAAQRSTRSCSRPTRARSLGGLRPGAATASRWPRAPSGSTAPTCSSASSTPSASPARTPRSASASCCARCASAPRRTAASRPGLDRTVMLLAGTDNIRDVIAFPKIARRLRPADRRADARSTRRAARRARPGREAQGPAPGGQDAT